MSPVEGLLWLLDLDRGSGLLSSKTTLHLLKTHTQHVLEVTDKLVNVSLPGNFANDALVVIVTEAPAQLLVVHARFVLPRAPLSSNLFGVIQFELPLTPSPRDAVLVLPICQQLEEELPELYRARASEGHPGAFSGQNWRCAGRATGGGYRGGVA